jgi:hypothetical protein
MQLSQIIEAAKPSTLDKALRGYKRACDAASKTDKSESHGPANPVLDASEPAEAAKPAKDGEKPKTDTPPPYDSSSKQKPPEQPPQDVQKLAAYYTGALEHILGCCKQAGVDPKPLVEDALKRLE